jgi:type IV pilus assembly protein PilV
MTIGAIAMVATEKGFTLIEVLVATVVLSMGLLGLARVHIAAIQANTIASRLTQATTLAQDRVEQLLALPYKDPGLADNTYTETNPQGYTLTWEVDTDLPSTGMKTINVDVTWKNKAGQPKTFSLSVQKSSI